MAFNGHERPIFPEYQTVVFSFFTIKQAKMPARPFCKVYYPFFSEAQK